MGKVKSRKLPENHEEKPPRTLYTSTDLGIPGLSELAKYHSTISRKPVENHSHKDCMEITLMVRGSNVLSVDGKKYIFSGGDVFVIPADLPHETGSQFLGICTKYIVSLNLKDSSFLFLDGEWAVSLQRSLGNLQTGVYQGVDLSSRFLSDMFSFLTSNSRGTQYEGVSYLLFILQKIIKSQPKINSPLSANIQSAVEFIHESIFDIINLEALAEKANMSLPHFKQRFHEQIGMPPRMYINTEKVKIAQELLISGKSIDDTADELGFNSPNYFSTVFRKFTATSPGEFVKKSSLG